MARPASGSAGAGGRTGLRDGGLWDLGRAELHSEGQMVLLEPGNAWVVPRHARHTYKILEPFTAVEATHPPAEIHDRDRPVGQGNRSDSEQDSA